MPSHQEHAHSKEPLNILLVDDQPAKLLSYEVILRELGENLIRASSGREALEKLLKNDIAIVIAELRRLSNRLIGAQDEERRRIARELHDGLGQELAAARMILDQISGETSSQQADELRQFVDHAIEHVRNLSYLLHPPLLDEVGLFPALRCYLDGFTKRSRIRTSLEVCPPDMVRIAPEIEMAMFRIVQEALTNVFRHSAARNVSITITQQSQALSLVVLDDGKGMDAEITKLEPNKIGVGIAGMQQRAKDLGGEFRVANANPGTVLEIVVPYSVAGSRELSPRDKISKAVPDVVPCQPRIAAASQACITGIRFPKVD